MRGLYIHIPFCRSKCPYCGFYSCTNIDDDTITKYLNACIKSIDYIQNKNFDTIYMGGGTPSSIKAPILANFIERLLKAVNYKGKEFSCEANPESADEDFIKIVSEYPITRISLGVQSTDNKVLKLLGRIHSAEDAIIAAERLIKTGKSINTDIIYDIPSVNKKIFFKTAEIITALNPDHISAYSYSSDDRGYLKGFDSDESIYEEMENFLNSKGYEKYEISNFSKKGKECKHNIIYWQGEEYAGIGAGAHSFIYKGKEGIIRYSYPKNINEFMKKPNARIIEKLSGETAAKEMVVFGLRMKKGVNIKEAEKRFGKLPENLLKNINKYISLELLQWEGSRLKTTKRGELVLDYLSSCLWA